MPPQSQQIAPIRDNREAHALTTTLSRSRFKGVKMPYLTCKSRKKLLHFFLDGGVLVPVPHLLPHEFVFNVLFKTKF